MRRNISKPSNSRSLPASEDANRDAIEEDDCLTIGTSQLSVNDCASEPASELASDSDASQPSRTSDSSLTSHACTFDIDFTTLRYRGKLLEDVQYRLRHKRILNSRAKISWVYQHGADLQAKGYEKLWLCRTCHLKKDYSSQLFDAKSTSSISAHLNKSHGITEPGKLSKSTSSQVQGPSEMELIRRGVLPPPFDDKEYKKNLIDAIITNDLSFASVENAQFRKLLTCGRDEIEQALPSSHNTIKQWVLDSFQTRKIQIKDKISLAKSKINISIDGWRAPNRDDYLAICSHFISDDFKPMHCLLGFQKVHGPKSGANIAEIVAKVINDYEIGHNLGAFMMDNARDNDTALKELATRYDIDVDSSRLRCLGHIINLVVKALLFGKGVSKLERQLAGASFDEAFKIWNSKGPIGKLHNICVYVNQNSTRMEMFKDCQAGEALQVYRLLVDGGIRWNSTEAMISRGMLTHGIKYLYQVLTNASNKTPRRNYPLPSPVETSKSERCLRPSKRLSN